MSRNPKNPRAFPFTIPGTAFLPAGGHDGMSLLDWLAGHALSGAMTADLRFPDNLKNEVLGGLAMRCYDCAEAMLVERQKRLNNG